MRRFSRLARACAPKRAPPCVPAPRAYAQLAPAAFEASARAAPEHTAFEPACTDYFWLDLSDAAAEQAVGPPRVERTRLEAAARRIAEQLLLRDGANSALLEAELEQDGARYLREYVDTRDARPPATRLSSAQVSNRLYGLLGPPAQARGRQPQLLGDVARFMAAHQVVKLSDYHRMVRWLLRSSMLAAAADVMDTLLMSRQSGFGTATYALCLELALRQHDAQRFGALARRAKWPRKRWLALQHKFDAPGFDAKDPAVARLLAAGYLQFNRSRDLAYLVSHAPTPELLAVNMRAAAKWGDAERARWTAARFAELRDVPAAARAEFERAAAAYTRRATPSKHSARPDPAVDAIQGRG